jgi:hypothetical protein
MKPETPTSPDYQNVLDLIQIIAQSVAELADIQSQADQHLYEFFDHFGKNLYSDLQTSIADATAAAEAICRSHPEWFLDRKSLRTPFGTATLRATSSLDIANEELTIALLETAGKTDPEYLLAVKITKTVDRAVLSALDDLELKSFRVKRVEGQSFSVKPAEVNLGKAISTGEEKEKAGAA